ncbi:AraC-like DNA-binding protein [Arthrobacter pigmenti]|uniref:AraC-like DNA-binding protein n=1 Tax=Arthrobacter pigmenti TaxID=271432 RepID=A0A846RNC0_9MICC|nr:AraC-like DNA-binding protein [Arthrobacter pigmenti]
MAAQTDPISRGQLQDPSLPAPQLFRYAPDAEYAHIIRHFWIPVWDFPNGVTSHQKVLQYPSTLLVIAPDYAIAKGPELALSHKVLSGTSWAFGVLFQAAAGYRLHGARLAELVNGEIPLTEVAPGMTGLIRRVRAEMAAAPSSSAVHARCMALAVETLGPMCGPLDPEESLINAITDHVETTPSLTRVDKLAVHAGLDERALQRLTRKRLGLSPKWLIQRRRLQEAGVRLAAGGCTVSQVAANLGYADQAHFTRDFAQVIGMTPGEYLRMNNP